MGLVAESCDLFWLPCLTNSSSVKYWHHLILELKTCRNIHFLSGTKLFLVNQFHIIDTGFVAACKVGWPIKARGYEYDGASGLTVVAPGKQFYCNGEVTMWRYQATRATELQAIVFRPVSSNTTEYEVVGVNDITITADEINKPVSYMVPEGKRIGVEAGDVIGWSFLDAAITLDIISDSAHDAGSNLVRWIEYYFWDHETLTLTFNNAGSRKYSIEATVQVSLNISSSFLLNIDLRLTYK